MMRIAHSPVHQVQRRIQRLTNPPLLQMSQRIGPWRHERHKVAVPQPHDRRCGDRFLDAGANVLTELGCVPLEPRCDRDNMLPPFLAQAPWSLGKRTVRGSGHIAQSRKRVHQRLHPEMVIGIRGIEILILLDVFELARGREAELDPA